MAKENKHLEIERRWLLSDLPIQEIFDGPNNEWADIRTVYIATYPRLEVRIRKQHDILSGNTTFPVVMKLGKGLIRQESPKLLADEDEFCLYSELHKPPLPFSAENCWKILLPNGSKVEIKRFKEPADIFGLTLAEMEFDSEEEARQFREQDFPEWLKPLIIKEVTNDPRYNGKNLAVYGRPNPV